MSSCISVTDSGSALFVRTAVNHEACFGNMSSGSDEDVIFYHLYCRQWTTT